MISSSKIRRSILAQSLLVVLCMASFVPPVVRGQEQSKEEKKTDQEKKKEEGLPLKPGRKVEITTDEGTWMSPDLSTDGSTIAFDLLDDIYTMPATGREAQLISC